MKKKPAMTGWQVGWNGAVLANGLAIVGAFVAGAIFGSSPLSFSAVGASEPAQYGLQGGGNALGVLIWSSLGTFGAIPLIIGVAGASAALAIRRMLSRRSPVTTDDFPEPPHPEWHAWHWPWWQWVVVILVLLFLRFVLTPAYIQS